MARTHALATLRHRDFLLLWLGQLVSQTGDMMQNIAVAWNMYLLTGSPLMVGLIAVSRGVPSILLSLWGGALADAVDRKKLVLAATAIQMTVTSVLVVATYTNHVAVWLLFTVSALGGATQAFAGPARQALVPNVVPPEELSNAFTLLTLMRQVAAISGPGLGGLSIATLGLGATYLANDASFIAVILAMLFMGAVPMVAATRGSSWERIVDGLRFAGSQPIIFVPLLIDGATRLVVSFQPLLPLLASDVFQLGPQGLGWLSSASSAGAVAGGLAIGMGRYGRHPMRLMLGAYLIEGVFIAGLGLTPLFKPLLGTGAFGIALFMLFGNGVCDVLAEVSRNTVLQLKTPDELRGRVNAFSSLVAGGFPQLGQLEMGGMASAFGPIVAGAFGGIASILIILGILSPRAARQEMIDYTFDPPEAKDKAVAV